MPLEHSPTRDTESQQAVILARNAPQTSDAVMNQQAGAANTQEGPENAINATHAIKLPQPFWREMPMQWFTVAKAAFSLSRITSDETKYRYVLVNLDPTILPFISDIIVNPPEQDKYGCIKKRMIEVFGESQETKLRQLLRGREMGHEKPSVFLQRIRNLAAGQVTDNVVRTLFLEQLPENIRSILAISQVEDLAQLALQADKIVEVSKPQVMAVSSNGTPPDSNAVSEPTIAELKTMIEELALEVRRGRYRRRFDNRKARPRSNTNRRNRDKVNNNNYCYYHRCFGENAKKCEKPCSWAKPVDKQEN